MTDLSRLVEESKQMFAELRGDHDGLSRTMGELCESSASIMRGGSGLEGEAATAASETDRERRKTAAVRLLAHKQFDPEEVGKQLAAAQLAQTGPMPAAPAEAAIGINAFLQQRHDLVVTSAVEECRRWASHRAQAAADAQFLRAWKQERQGVLDSLRSLSDDAFSASAGPPPEVAASGGFSSSFSAREGGAGAGLSAAQPARHAEVAELNPYAEGYAEIVVDMNRARRHGSRLTYPAVTRFAKHARALAQRHAHANEASKLLWPLLERMFGAREEREATEGAHAAFGAPSRDPAAVAAVTARGRAHLEDSFRLAAERRGTGSEAGAGALGVARAFVQALFASRPAVRRACASSPRERASGASAWAVAYLTLRMGGVGAAARIVREVCAADLDAAADVVTCVNRLERMLGAGRADTPAAGAAAAAAAADSRSEAAACARLSVAADTHAVARGDPFRSLLLALLSGRTAPKRARALVCESVQDFMWLQLAHVAAPAPRDGAEAEGVPGTPASSGGSGGAQSAGKRAPASIGQLAARVLRYGAGHFDPRGDRPADYAQVLLLCLEPERAASHLAAHGRLPDAVHMALALQHSGALLTATALAEHGLLEGAVPVAGSPFLGEIRMSRGGSARPRAALNVTEMLRAQSLYLTRSRPQLAAHYARHVPDPGRRAALLAEVLLISGAYDQMLGPAAAQRVGGGPSTGPESEERGELARLVLPDSHVARVVALAAEGAVAQGDTLAAVKLRVRAGQWTEALQLLATELSRVASGGGGERRRVWLDVARDVRALSVEQAMGARFGETSAHGGSVAHLLSVVDGMLALADLADNVHAADGSAASVAALDSAVQRAEAVVPLRAPEQAQAAHVQVAAFSALPPPLRELANESLPLYVGALQRLLEARVREVSGVTVDAESLVRQAELAVALSGAPEVHGIAEHTRTTLIQMYEAMRRLA